jgi:hypothetical protein
MAMKVSSERKNMDGVFIFKTERDFFRLIDERLEKEGFEVLDIFGPMPEESRPAQIRLQEGA